MSDARRFVHGKSFFCWAFTACNFLLIINTLINPIKNAHRLVHAHEARMRSPSHSKHAMNRPVQQESSAAPIAAASATTPTGRQDAPFTFQHTPTLYTEELAVEDGVRLLGSLQVPGSPEETEAEKKRSHFFKAVDLRAARPPACAQLRLRSIHYSISRGERGGACCAAVFTCVARAGPAAAPRCTQIPGPHLSPEPPAIRVTVQGITVETTMYE